MAAPTGHARSQPAALPSIRVRGTIVAQLAEVWIVRTHSGDLAVVRAGAQVTGGTVVVGAWVDVEGPIEITDRGQRMAAARLRLASTRAPATHVLLGPPD